MSQKHDDSEHPRDVYPDRRKMADRREREHRARQEKAISSSLVAVLPHEVKYEHDVHQVRIVLPLDASGAFTTAGTWQSSARWGARLDDSYQSGLLVITPSAARLREIAVALWSAADEIEETSR